LVTLATLGAIACGVLALGVRGDLGREGFVVASRFTARWSFTWFMVAFSASSLALLWPTRLSDFLLRERRGLGLGFAAAHLVHAGFFLTAIQAFGLEVDPFTVVGSGIGYLFVLGLAFTSNDGARRRIGLVAWRRFHRFGVGYLALIFGFTYWSRIPTRPWVAFIGLAALAMGLSLRAGAYLANRRVIRAG
jgi:DMSO/TMAO reductase YedYZ heme-binding membrane subunit